MLFGNSGDVSGIEPSEEQRRLTGVMQRAWVKFARDSVRGFDPEEETLVLLGYQDSAVPDFVRPEVYSWNCSNVVLASG
jgi:cholinesterase